MGWLKSEHMFGKNDIMKLNLGSGKKNMVGYVNIDAISHTKETVIGDILNLTYGDESISHIYSSHVIEHLDKNELRRFFSECSRMLCKGGELELLAPSITLIINNFNAGLVDIDYVDDFLYALHLHQYDYHKQGIYKEKLERLCLEYGFNVNEISHINDIKTPEIHIISIKK